MMYVLNRTGNQWTPAMFEALLQDAKVAVAKAAAQHGDQQTAQGAPS